MERIKKIFSEQLDNFELQKETIKRLWNIEEQTAQLLYFFVLAKSPENILEIGTSNGYSTFWLSLAAEKCKATIYSLEIDKTRFEMAKENLKTRQNIIQYLGNAEDIIPNLKEKLDFVFIDAGKINYLNYLKLLLDKLNDKAFIFSDNMISHQESTKKYLNYIQEHNFFEIMILNINSGLGITVFHKNKFKESLRNK